MIPWRVASLVNNCSDTEITMRFPVRISVFDSDRRQRWSRRQKELQV
jgi:hypothetical protein